MQNEKNNEYRKTVNWSKDSVEYALNAIFSQGICSIAALEKVNCSAAGRRYLDSNLALSVFLDLAIIKGTKESFSLGDEGLLMKKVDGLEREHLFRSLLVKYVVANKLLDLDNVVSVQNAVALIPKVKTLNSLPALRNLLDAFEILECSGSHFLLKKEFLDYIQSDDLVCNEISPEKLEYLLKKEKEQGAEGEKFVLDFEKRRLKNHVFVDKIKQISLSSTSAGYDIASFNDLSSLRRDRYIEVKTYKEKVHFFWSRNEMDVAQKKRKNYFLYLVDYDKIEEEGYIPEMIQDPAETLKADCWEKIPETIRVSLVDDL